MAEGVVGWDLGGAHLKLAQIGGDGRLLSVGQTACPLWQGLDKLEAALDKAEELLQPCELHALTMTGGLTDLFR